MDALITAAARFLAAGDALSALQRVALRDDPPALALRGIAMAQLGEHPRARELLRRAAKAFGPKEAVARAGGVVGVAEGAVAGAIGANPIPIIVPCHRVLGSGGTEGGFSGGQGLPTKRKLLALEGVVLL